MSVPVSLRGPLRYGKAALRPPRSLLQPGQPQLSLPVLTGKVLQPWDRLCSLLLRSCFSSLRLSACLSCRAPGGAGQTRSRHGAAMEDARSSSAAEEEEEGLSPVWLQPHYKWQHTEAPWGTASSGPSLHPPVHLQLLLVSRGKEIFGPNPGTTCPCGQRGKTAETRGLFRHSPVRPQSSLLGQGSSE